ncbi:MAG: hypothetical protein CVV64_03580 [Candidatus Wallbacteria bacterium HGW-Wallbacteria-1]|jgi:glycosyltransferase involved in cell wall biosynthesis|uniref:Glycosyltransferase 2-like domain-containing protein n=1 Tax=Candidatus Wallbacteria bacterium HGW-Wallbacteria-1 TaxID=2013854 RepID=A0A2N1PTX4_9BACT|nr:MAG: hypothetical protein CVV64_03580 [Candidatus Wallbacteria bacterium HGW-Wallbacteria-1]
MRSNVDKVDVSVVVPVYNNGHSIRPLLESLLNQNFTGSWEIIVADDGSSDDTADFARSFKGVRVVCISHAGPAAARNAGARTARGKVILFTDSDCVPASDWLRLLSAPLLSGRAQAAKGRYLTRQKGFIARLVQVEFEERYALLSRVSFIDFVDTYSMAVLAELFHQLGGFDETFTRPDNEDVDFSWRLSSAGAKMVYVDEAIVFHHHPSSLVSYMRTKFGRGFWRMKVYRSHPAKMISDSYTPQTLKFQCIAAIAILFMVLIRIMMKLLHYLFGKNGISAASIGSGCQRLISLLGISFCLSSLPLSGIALRRDFPITFLIPFFVFARGLSIGVGAIAGFLRWYLKENSGEGEAGS